VHHILAARDGRIEAARRLQVRLRACACVDDAYSIWLVAAVASASAAAAAAMI